MSKLLKEAIADAGLVRETALANAKLALEEAFTPTIQSMLSKKIQSEVEGDEEVEELDDSEEVAVEDEEGGEEAAVEEPAAELDIPSDEVPAEEGEVAGDEVEEDEEWSGDDEVAVEDEELGEDDEEDLDLESILRELEDGIEDEEEVTENEGGEIESGVADEDEEIAESEDVSDVEVDEDEEAGEEELDLESVLKALSEEDDDDDDDDEEEVEEVVNLRNELEEHKDVIKRLRSELNEINLLNAKLLFTNKLFKSYDIDNAGKLRVVEMFDRTKNIREIKLVYATLQESFKGGKVGKKVKPMTEGFASKPVASTKSSKPKEIISEGSDFANRLKKLAGIK